MSWVGASAVLIAASSTVAGAGRTETPDAVASGRPVPAIASGGPVPAVASSRPAVTFEPTRVVGPVREDVRRAFSAALESAARRRFEERRWRVIGPPASSSDPGSTDPCPAQGCAGRGVHELSSQIVAESGGDCRVQVRLRAETNPEPRRELDAVVEGCAVDAILVRAEGLGAAISAGPRWQPQVQVVLASTLVPDLHVRTLPDVRAPALAQTSTVPRSLTLDEALERYREASIVVFRDDDGGLRFARAGRLLGECGLRRAAQAPLTRAQRVFCRGNAWAWSLVGVPAGGLMAAASFPELELGNLHGFVGVGLGLISATAAAALALTQMEFGHDPDSGEYLSDPGELRRLALESNHRLRMQLGLTEAEVELPPLESP